MTLPGAPEKELSKSWVLFKRFYRQASSEINAGTGHEQSAQGTEEAPRSCLEKQGSRGTRTAPPAPQTYPWQQQPVQVPPKASTASLAGVCF